MIEDVPLVSASARTLKGLTDRKAMIQDWGGTKMIRTQSFLGCIKEICIHNKEIEVVRVGIVGDMGTGKTTMAQAIAHSMHVMMKTMFDLPFAVRVLTKSDLKAFEETIKKLEPTNYILIFDDVSFMEAKSSKKEMSAVKEALTTIRHMGSEDVRIALIYGYHYNLALDKYLRQTDFRFWTTVGASEYENMERILRNRRAMNLVRNFQRQRKMAVSTHTWTCRFGRDGKHTYHWRKPWIPALFYDNHRLRQIVSPKREWLAPTCPTCDLAQRLVDGGGVAAAGDEITPAQFVAEGRKSLGVGAFNSALKLVALENGLGTYSRPVLAAKKSIESALRVKRVRLESLLIECGIEINKPRLRAGYSKFLESIAVPQGPGAPAAPGGPDAVAERTAAAAAARAAAAAAAAQPADEQAAAIKTPAPPRIV